MSISKEKKNLQQEENILVMEFLEDFTKNFIKAKSQYNYFERLRYCTAWVYGDENFYILVSYSTPIAIIDKKQQIGYDFLRLIYGYTSTSAQHISKFFHDYPACLIHRYYNVGEYGLREEEICADFHYWW